MNNNKMRGNQINENLIKKFEQIINSKLISNNVGYDNILELPIEENYEENNIFCSNSSNVDQNNDFINRKKNIIYRRQNLKLNSSNNSLNKSNISNKSNNYINKSPIYKTPISQKRQNSIHNKVFLNQESEKNNNVSKEIKNKKITNNNEDLQSNNSLIFNNNIINNIIGNESTKINNSINNINKSKRNKSNQKKYTINVKINNYNPDKIINLIKQKNGICNNFINKNKQLTKAEKYAVNLAKKKTLSQDYELQKKIKEEQEIKKQKEEMSQCTFKPKLYKNKYNNKKILHKNKSTDNINIGKNIYEKQNRWMNKIQEKNKKEFEIKKNKEIENCTFIPRLSNMPNYNKKVVRITKREIIGEEEYYLKMKKARKLQEEKNKSTNLVEKYDQRRKKKLINPQNNNISDFSINAKKNINRSPSLPMKINVSNDENENNESYINISNNNINGYLSKNNSNVFNKMIDYSQFIEYKNIKQSNEDEEFERQKLLLKNELFGIKNNYDE